MRHCVWIIASVFVAMPVVPGGAFQIQRPTQPEAVGSGLILGQVVDADTGRGISNALVSLTSPSPPITPLGELTESRAPIPTNIPTAKRILTAPDGRFVFRNLPKGSFAVYTTIATHVPGMFGQLRPHGPGQTLDLGDAEKRAGVTIRMWKNGVISGTVRDENGEPAVGVGVECSRRVITGGQRRFASPAAGLATDDRGMYRVANLAPGDYLCGVIQNLLTVPVSVDSAEALASWPTTSTPEARRASNSGAPVSVLGVRVDNLVFNSGASTLRGRALPPPDAGGRLMAYPPVYYPSAPSSTQATLVAVKAGEEKSGIDLQLTLVPAVRISGTLNGPTGPISFFGLRLVPVSANEMASEGQAQFATTTTDPSGAFTFLGVPSGQYLLKGRLFPRPAPGGNLAAAFEETSLWTSTPITVGDKDITNLAITLRPGIRVSGRVEFTGGRTPAPAEIQRVAPRMQSAEGRTSSPIPLEGRTLADGTFKTSGYPAGRYIANVLANTVPPGWSVKSITHNGRDVSVEPLDLVEADVSGVVITFTDKMTTLSGSVTGANGPESTAEVVVFPADSMAWKEVGAVSRRSRTERVSRTGDFAIIGLPPGDYFVVAVPGSVPGDRQDPALLTTLTRTASRVSLADGGSATVQLALKR